MDEDFQEKEVCYFVTKRKSLNLVRVLFNKTDKDLDEPKFLPREAFRDGRERDETEDDGGAESDNSGQKVSVVQQSLFLLSRLDRYLLFQDL